MYDFLVTFKTVCFNYVGKDECYEVLVCFIGRQRMEPTDVRRQEW